MEKADAKQMQKKKNLSAILILQKSARSSVPVAGTRAAKTNTITNNSMRWRWMLETKIIRTKIQWRKVNWRDSCRTNERVVLLARSLAHTHTQPIIYSWTIKTVSREIFGAMRLFIFCPTLSRRAFLFIRSHSRRIQASDQWQRRRQQRPYLWRFLFSISSQFLVFGSTYVDWKKGERKWNEIRALPLIRMTKRRWRTRLTNAPSARALVVTLMACRTQWWVNELLKNALVVRSMTELRHRTQSDEKKRNEYEYKKKKWCSPVCNLVE